MFGLLRLTRVEEIKLRSKLESVAFVKRHGKLFESRKIKGRQTRLKQESWSRFVWYHGQRFLLAVGLLLPTTHDHRKPRGDRGYQYWDISARPMVSYDPEQVEEEA